MSDVNTCMCVSMINIAKYNAHKGKKKKRKMVSLLKTRLYLEKPHQSQATL